MKRMNVDPRVSRMRERLSRIGGRLGNWNDRLSARGSWLEASFRWRVVDRLASWLYVRPEKP